MKYNIFNSDNTISNSNNTDTLSFIIIIISILFIINYIYPIIIDKYTQETFESSNKILNSLPAPIYNKIDEIDKNKIHEIDKNPCSKQCCKFTQWPVPFNTKNPIVSDDTLNKFIPSNFSCNFGEGSGCVCITKDDYNYLSQHGQ